MHRCPHESCALVHCVMYDMAEHIVHIRTYMTAANAEVCLKIVTSLYSERKTQGPPLHRHLSSFTVFANLKGNHDQEPKTRVKPSYKRKRRQR